MSASIFFTVLGATFGFLASVFFCVGALRMRVRDIVDVTSSMWDYTAALVKLWAAQRADYTAGALLLILAFVLQIIGAVTPSDLGPEILQPIGCVISLIIAAFVAALVLATVLRNQLRQSVTEEVMAQHQSRLQQEDRKGENCTITHHEELDMFLKRWKSLLIPAALVILPGCTPGMVGALTGHKTGDTVGVVSRSPSHITLAYTHSYAEELPAASQMADSWCRQNGGKRALLVQNTRNNLDRSTATFSCGQ